MSAGESENDPSVNGFRKGCCIKVSLMMFTVNADESSSCWDSVPTNFN